MGFLKLINAILLLTIGTGCNICRNDIFHYVTRFQCHKDGPFASEIINRTEGQHPSEELRTNNAEPPIAPFEDWAKLKIQEHGEKMPIISSAGIEPPNVKAIRNYAGKECGAKILEANLEAQNPSAILNDKELDEYMLNPCITEIAKWFVIELCETVQIGQFEMANFELFSCRPKEFKIWTSERYPSPEWSLLGQYVAEDKREIHAFPIDRRRVYAKYLKIELLSHHGGEHFCSLTFIRVLGVSMVEEYENDAAALVPQRSTDRITVNASAQSQEIKAKNVTFAHIDEIADSTTIAPGKGNQYLQDAKSAMLSAAKEFYGKVFNGPGINGSDSSLLNATNNSFAECPDNRPKNERESSRSKWMSCLQCPPRNVSQSWCTFFSLLMVANNMRTTRTTTTNDETKSPDYFVEPKIVSGSLASPNNNLSATPTASLINNDSVQQQPQHSPDHGDVDGRNRPAVSAVVKDDQLSSSTHSSPPPSSPSSSSPPVLAGVVSGHKESVFARMNQRIKALELNVSLSGQYLAELSRRYTQQMHRIERAFNATSRLFSETDQKFQHRLDQQAADLLTTAHKLARIEGALDKILPPVGDGHHNQERDQCGWGSAPMLHVWCIVAVFANLLIVALCRKAVISRQEELVKQLRSEFRTALRQNSQNELEATCVTDGENSTSATHFERNGPAKRKKHKGKFRDQTGAQLTVECVGGENLTHSSLVPQHKKSLPPPSIKLFNPFNYLQSPATNPVVKQNSFS